MSVNKVILLGNLGKDPDLRYTPSGKAVATFSLATSERWTSQDGQKQENTTWHNIVAWGKQAETMKEYLTKGRQVYIEGRIANRSYEDKEGNKKYISEVVVQSFSFVGNKGSSGNGGGQTTPAEPAAETAPDAGSSETDDDLPF
ncbi:MAG: single-stranded DNA-binding protein [candidate division Zixibacteria bacterium]|nr:single-stranded DNA-binding protein [candidate division Zixibacteria bacterium]